MVTFYTTHCSKCRVLESKLKDAGIKYETVTDQNVMVDKGFMSAPMLEVNGKPLKYPEAITWVNSQ